MIHQGVFMRSVLLSIFALLTLQIVARAEETPTYPNHRDLLEFRDADGKPHPVKTPADWHIRRKHIVASMEQAMGKLPDRTQLVPLDMQTSEDTEQDGVRRLTVSIAAEPGSRVTAYLYIPKGIQPGERRAGMLVLHPTGPLGKGIVAGDGPRPNRANAIELAKRGYVVIAPDYPSFGDLTDYDFEKDRYDSGSMKGIWNHMRCVDLLVSRPDVDPERIGVIGHSLGGHNSMFVAVFDQRIKAVVSSCGWCPFHDYYGGKIKGWTSTRYMPRLNDVYGLDPDRVPFDFYEVVAALAPRAFFSNSPISDSNFDVAGVKKAIPRAQAVYDLLGASNGLQVRYPESGHDFPDDVRFESYRFLDDVLKHKPTQP
jgi:acetyl esterase/lipase